MNPLIRPARRDDIARILHFAQVRASGITSLPADEEHLAHSLETSIESFQGEKDPLEVAHYLFVLEYGKEVIGICGIKTAIGTTEPFFVYELTEQMQKCAYLSLEYALAVLNFHTINSRPTEIGALYLERKYRKRHFGRLLSYSRFLFMATFPQRFSTVILAQLRGVNVRNRSPFWDAVGSKFYGLTFEEADRLRADHPDAIGEIFPRSPIYPAMLPKKAQEVIRVPHPDTVPARLLLEKEGFKISPYLDLFDAGPHMYAARETIRTICESRTARLHIRPQVEALSPSLICNTQLNFRATIAPIHAAGEMIFLTPNTAHLLEVEEGDTIRYCA